MKSNMVKVVMVFVMLLFSGCGAKQYTTHVVPENQICYTQNANITDNIASEHNQTTCPLSDKKEPNLAYQIFGYTIVTLVLFATLIVRNSLPDLFVE
jgi:uncharacterized protein YceK